MKVVVLLMLVVFLYAFSNGKNTKRLVGEPNITFTGSDNMFISHDGVSKLLIQNQSGLENATKEIIDLSLMEATLNANPMVHDAQVFMSVNGELSAIVEQKRPIARVHTNASYYIDEEGSYMPLSNNFSARVPLVTGVVYKNKLKKIHEMASAIDKDFFLKKHVIEINQDENQNIQLRLRRFDFNVEFGDLSQLNKKINNFKVFYQKAVKDKTISTYSNVNLRFENQVICTKK